MKRKMRAGARKGQTHERREAHVGERGLWRAIVLQTVYDYFLAGGHEKWKSERLLWGDQKGYFDIICDNAGIDGDWARRRVKEYEAKGDVNTLVKKLKRQPMAYARYILGES
jgi:hypothetical protein